MKSKLVVLFCISYISSFAQTLGISGKYITQNGNNVILRGINYPFIDDGNIDLASPTSYQYYLNQASLTGANTMRIAWYTPGTHWRDLQTPGTLQGYITNGHLNNIISFIESKNIISIIDIHNATCSNDWNYFNNTIIPYWTSSEMVSLIQAHQNSLILNICNEFGYANWTSNPSSAMSTFKTNYKNAITQIRNAGINVPLMIDAPDCGTASSELLSVAQELLLHDPLHKIVFSAHSYWGSYAPTLANVVSKLDEISNSNLCWFFGEVTIKQDDVSCGDLDLSTFYPSLLTKLCQRDIGWTAWTYNQDCSPLREMTTNGVFANLTPFGDDLVNNPNYGFKSTGGCGVSLNVQNLESVENPIVFPNPNNGVFFIKGLNIKTINAFDMLGNEVKITKYIDASFEIKNQKSGIYLLKMVTKNNQIFYSKITLR